MFRLEPLALKGIPQEDQYEAFKQWRRGLENILNAMDVPEERRFSNLMAYGGTELQKVYYNIDKDAENTEPLYKDALKKLNDYFKPKHHAVFARHKFWQLKWGPEDSLDEVVMKMKEASGHCTFGKDEAESLEIAMVDKLLMLVSQEIKEKLLQKTDLSFDKAIKIIKAHDATKYQARELSGRKPAEFAVNAVARTSFAECHRCGSKRHKANDDCCPAKDAMCMACRKTGHFARKCMSSKGKRPYEGNDGDNYKRRKVEVRYMKEERDNTGNANTNRLNVLSVNDGGIKVVCAIGNVFVKMMIDSGTSRNIIDGNTWELMVANGFKPKDTFFDSNVHFTGYGNKKLEQLHAFRAPISICNAESGVREELATFYVIQDGSQPLLSQGNYMRIFFFLLME